MGVQVDLEESIVGGSQGSGLAERAFREETAKIRMLKKQVEEMHKEKLEVDFLIDLWLVEFAATSINLAAGSQIVGLCGSCVVADHASASFWSYLKSLWCVREVAF